jgi:hypothetical protein
MSEEDNTRFMYEHDFRFSSRTKKDEKNSQYKNKKNTFRRILMYEIPKLCSYCVHILSV